MDKVSLLSGSPLFEMLSNDELRHVAELTSVQSFAEGDVVFEEGEQGDCLYVVAAGEVEVLTRDAAGVNQRVAVLEPPQFFGEMGLIELEYRSATVRAKTDCELLTLTAEKLTAFRTHHRDGFTFVIINVAKMLSTRLREANARARNAAPRHE